jgi:hypothetical protein
VRADTWTAWPWIIWRIVLALLLGAVAVRSGHLALYNWWAAGVPPNPNLEKYQHLGNTFFAVSSVCLASALTLAAESVRGCLRMWRRRRS